MPLRPQIALMDSWLPHPLNILRLLALLLSGLMVRNCFKAFKEIKAFGFHPGVVYLFDSDPFWERLPDIVFRYFNIAFRLREAWKVKRTFFTDGGWDVATCTTVFPPMTRLYVADAGLAQRICTSTEFQQLSEPSHRLRLYGDSIFTVDGHELLAHQRLINHALSGDGSNICIWEETVRLVNEMFEGWNGGDYKVSDATSVTKLVTLLVTSSVTLGQSPHWSESNSSNPPVGHRTTFRETITRAICPAITLRLITPKFIWGSTSESVNLHVAGPAGEGWLGQRLQGVAETLNELGRYMEETAAQQRADESGNRRDLLSQLVIENDKAGVDSKSSIQELFENSLVFLILGHENIAHNLAFLLGLLALEEEKQNILYTHIKGVIGDRPPVYEHFASLSYVLATFREGLRLYPPVHNIRKVATEDTFIEFGSAANPVVFRPPHTKDLFIRKGTEVYVNVPGLHYNSKYWQDPYAFRPERFLEPNWPREAFVPFSSGNRSCPGQRLAEIEAVAFLTLLVSRYKICVDTELFPDVPGETALQRRERLLDGKAILTFMPKRVPLIFIRR